MFDSAPTTHANPSWVSWLSAQLFGRARNPWLLVAGLMILELGVAALVFTTGGTRLVYLQLMYIPVVLSGLLFGSLGGSVGGAIGGLLVGPLMPLEVATSQMQPTLAWVIRLLIFVMNGVVAGLLSRLLLERIRSSEEYSQRIATAYQANLLTLAALVDERDTRTADHSERVAFNAQVMGRTLGLNERELFELYWASMLHDLGKIGIPEHILHKPGPLEPDERIEIQRHVEIGCRILLSAFDTFKPIASLIRAHHERWDGLGYPDALRGEQIPLGARVLAVLDVFEALTSDRPYRSALPIPEALELIRRDAGTHFDPRVTNLFETLLARGEIALGEVPKVHVGGLLTASRLQSAS
jgi:hypothetical protein